MAKRKKARAQAEPAPRKRNPIRIILIVAIPLIIAGGAYFMLTQKPNPVAVIELAKGGTVEIELYADDTPNTVANFVKLVNKKFYDGLTFHRVEPGFVVQGGDPEGTGQGGPGYTIEDESSKNLHVRGAVGMAKSQAPNSAGSQFYICLGDASFLDGKYTVFGNVVKGMEYVDKIQIGDKMKTVTMKKP